MPTNNLPFQPTSFVGREKELAEIAALLADPNCRLLTLVGAGGIGKTRLALQIAATLDPHFVDGVYFVPLAPVTSSSLLASAIEGAFEIPFSQLNQFLRERQVLLALDNFEHFLKILITSRERLNLQEEWLFALDGLSYPISSNADSPENYSAIELFVQRARQVQKHYSLEDNLPTILSICQQVEGMPLALELAASWLHSLSHEQIVTQMSKDLDFLTTTLRNMPERHRSLRTVFEQSWRLLSADEQMVLMRVSVFRGGFDLETATQVAKATPLILAGLVGKSLIRVTSAGRYDSHELLRQYAAEKLAKSGASDEIAHRHLHYFMELAEQNEVNLFGRGQIAWFDHLEVELNNLWAALEWSLRDEEHEAGLRLVNAIYWFFTERDYAPEGLERLERLLNLKVNIPLALRAKTLQAATALSGYGGPNEKLSAYGEQAVALARELNDHWNLAWSLSHFGFYLPPNHDLAKEKLEESIRIFRELDDPFGLSHTLMRLNIAILYQNDIEYAERLIKETHAIALQYDDKIMQGWVNYFLSLIAYIRGHLKQSIQLNEESIANFREARFYAGIHFGLREQALLERKQGNLARARELYQEALILLKESGEQPDITLEGLARVAVELGNFSRAATLLSVIDPNIVNVTAKYFISSYHQDITTARAQLGESAFEEAWATGKAMTRRQIVAFALEDATTSARNESTPASNQPLTERELEILHLIADGLNSREIAQQLILGVGTIRWYLKQIYSKLDVHSRSEAIARARDLKILN